MVLRPALAAALVLAACVPPAATGPAGSAPPARPGAPAAPVVPGYDATRWLPAHPTYALAARDLRQAQRGLTDLLRRFGTGTPLDAALVSEAFRAGIGIDPLSPDALAGAGIDLAGGAAVFSEAIDPTFVLHLAAPDQTARALERYRAGAQVARVDGVDVLTAGPISWAIAGDWLWLHAAIGSAPDPTWFAHGRAGGGALLPDWARLARRGTPTAIAFVDLPALAPELLARVGIPFGACVRQLPALGHLDAAFDLDERHLGARLSVDLGAPAAAALAGGTLTPPPGWASATTGAALAAQWNVDTAALAAWVAPCLPAGQGSGELAQLRRFGVRAGRAALLSFQDEKTFTGALAVDLGDARYLASRLDDIPLRSHLESDRRFGPHAGHHLSIPMLFAIDYVLEPQLGLFARGDGLLERVTAAGPAAPPALVALDVAPAALTPGQWRAFAELVDAPAWLLKLVDWKAFHVGITLAGTELVIAASAERR